MSKWANPQNYLGYIQCHIKLEKLGPSVGELRGFSLFKYRSSNHDQKNFTRDVRFVPFAYYIYFCPFYNKFVRHYEGSKNSPELL
jgi:hypothetical protein